MHKLIKRFENAFMYIASFSSLVIMCLVTADAVARYLLNRGIFGVYDITEKYLMVVTVYLGVSYVYRGGGFIKVTFLVDRLPLRMKMAVNYCAHIFSIIICLIFLLATIKKTERILVTGANMEFWSLPLWPAYLVIPIGLFFLILVMILDIPRAKPEEADIFEKESPTI